MSGWLLLVMLAAAADPPSLALVNDAVKARQEGKLEESLVLFQRAYALDANPAILNNMGVVLDELGRYRAAHGAFTSVANDASASAELRALCSERARGLAVKKDRAFVRFSSALDGTLHLGTAEIFPGETERETAPGERWIALSGVVDQTLVFLRGRFNAGERLTITWPTDQVAGHSRVLLGHHAQSVEIEDLRLPLDESIAGLMVPDEARELFARSVRYRAPDREPPPLVVAPIEPAEEKSLVVPVTLFAAGAAMLVTAGVLYASASSDVSAVEDDMAADGVVNQRWTDARALDASAKRKGHFAIGFSLGGLIAAGAGGALLIF